MEKKFIVFGQPDIGADEIAEVVDSMRSGWIGTGPKVKLFEEQFRKYKNADYAVAVNSCTAALHLSLITAGVGKEDEVITSAMTFCSTVNTIIHCGATPVIVDCDKDTYCIDPNLIEEKITKRTKAIIPVHFAGNVCDITRIFAIAEKYKLKVIEDCAHAIESEFLGKKVGMFGDFGCFSFYATKNVTTGEGGMILTNDKISAEKLKVLALHGMSADAWQRFSDKGYNHYQVIHPGFKYNMLDLQAAIGIHQLKKIDLAWQKRKEIWGIYQNEFKNLSLQLPKQDAATTKHAFHIFPVLIQKEANISRDEFMLELQNYGIGAGVHYRSIPSHPCYRQLYNWNEDNYPVSKNVGETTVSIPLSPKLSMNEVEHIVNSVKKIIKSRTY